MIILIIILFIIILLIIGIRISLEYNKKGSEVKGCLKILIFKKLKVYSLNWPSEDNKEKEDDKKESKDRDFKKIFELAKPCFKDLKNYLKSVLKSMKIQKIQNHLIFGMDSYADTGEYIGIIWAICAIVNPMHKKMQISAEPSFTGSVLDGYGENNLEIYPLKLIVPTVKLILNGDVRKLIRGVLDER
ncbi:DUF2953 domain-containing protein [Methanobrevibacter thaueri]|uniref:DUF2953 domain-containing protein n=1 Tax=Methanobrevibacter thaueri TaxID=190975 RepID=UPI0026F029FE|nr:DUF2953 domain-containing protein [Methanobrevibacter thaueri]